jgi:endonuclease YncB( thermonuclease family)
VIRRLRLRVAAIALIAGCSSAGHAATLTARVADIHDGDTITVRVRTKTVTVRLIYIDAPELAQPWGRQARRSMQELVRLEEVRVRTKGKDKYSRTLGEVVRVRDGLDVNLEQVRRGMAWSYTRGAARPVYDAAEAEARQARIGLWQDATPERPSNFRKKQRERTGRSESLGAGLGHPLGLAAAGRWRGEVPAAGGDAVELGGFAAVPEGRHRGERDLVHGTLDQVAHGLARRRAFGADETVAPRHGHVEPPHVALLLDGIAFVPGDVVVGDGGGLFDGGVLSQHAGRGSRQQKDRSGTEDGLHGSSPG